MFFVLHKHDCLFFFRCIIIFYNNRVVTHRMRYKILNAMYQKNLICLTKFHFLVKVVRYVLKTRENIMYFLTNFFEFWRL